MKKKWFRKLKRLCRPCQKIIIEKQRSLDIDLTMRQLVIVRRIRPDGQPFNSIWLMGHHADILHKLYRWDGSHSKLGRLYDIKMKSFNYWLVIRKHNDLRTLCRKCGIKKIILIQFYLPDVNV